MPENIFEFEDFVLDRGAYELRRDGVVVPLQRIPLELLWLLVEHRGKLVTREEILERVWGKNVFLDGENSINTAVRKLRRALCDDPEVPRFITTIPGKGYRFVAETRRTNPARADRIRARLQTAMIGRKHELASLLRGLIDAASGRGRLFLISGEPGVGKTRLADEVAAAAGADEMVLLAGHCSEDEEAVAYLPFVEILENFVDRSSNPDSLRSVLGVQGPELTRLLPRLRSILPDLQPPLDLPPSQARRHLFNSYLDFVSRIASEHPTLMILEDLQWADESTLALLDHLTQRLSSLPLMVIGTYRDPELDVTRPLAKTLEALLRGRLSTRVRLKGLPRDEVGAMLDSLSGKSAPAAVVGEMFSETDGNPFFVEELFRHLEEENRLYDTTGEFRAQLKIGEADAPPSVRLVVGRRVARLSDLTRKMLARAATIGRSFSFELLQASAPGDGEALLGCIEEAESAGLILSIAGSPKARLAFSHELIRQAVIGSLSAARRQKLHREIADAMERTSSAEPESTSEANLDNHFADLAYHYARGGNPLKAVRYYRHAVRRFAHLGSSAEAVAQFESALTSLSELPDDDQRAELELDLRIAVSDPLGDLTGLASVESERCNGRALVLSQRPATRWGKAWTALYSYLFVHLVRPNQRKACEIAAELVSRTEGREGAEHLLADSGTYLACAQMYSGEFAQAAKEFERSWELLETVAKADLTPRSAEQTRRVRTVQRRLGSHENNRGLSAWNLWFLGYPDRALDRMNIASGIAYSGTRTMLADIHGFASYLHELRREPAQMRSRADARLALSTESSYAIGRPLSEIYLGWADAIAGDYERGIARIRSNQLLMNTAGSELANDRCAVFIATTLGRLKRFDEGLRTIDETFQFIERTGQKYYEAELHRLKGEMLLGKDQANSVRAEESFVAAIEIARKQHAKSWELRATTSLARMLTKNRKRARGRTILAEIYNWFTEGFGTGDLKDAKALLEELSS